MDITKTVEVEEEGYYEEGEELKVIIEFEYCGEEEAKKLLTRINDSYDFSEDDDYFYNLIINYIVDKSSITQCYEILDIICKRKKYCSLLPINKTMDFIRFFINNMEERTKLEIFFEHWEKFNSLELEKRLTKRKK